MYFCFYTAKIVYYVITCKNITNILPKMFYFSNCWLDIFICHGQIGTAQDKFGQPLPPVQI